MNPFLQKPPPLEEGIVAWRTAYPSPYDKRTVDPYTKVRIILLNGIEVASALFKHQFLRHCVDAELRRALSPMRYIEQLQQKRINWLKPIDETQLETTIGYEHVAVDLTAALGQIEPDERVKQALDFALLEDFDHLYRYANLLDLDAQIPAQRLVRGYVDITPGRPTIAEHRHPYDSVKLPIDLKTADIRTKLSTLIITAAEQQTMNFYMNVGNAYINALGRKLYLEIAMVEEQHVAHYGSLLDPTATWLENLLLHEYMECYLYHSFAQDETDPNVKAVFEAHFNQELAHLHQAAGLLARYEHTPHERVVGKGEFPVPLRFHNTRRYLRRVLGEQVGLTSSRFHYAEVCELPPQHDFFRFQARVNADIDAVASHAVIVAHQQRYNIDYRAESQDNPIPDFADRSVDNTTIARTPGA
jgi:hypothetical protein